MLAWKIALRYLISKKSHGAVNIISLISVIGVAVATMAITIVLSVFNGFKDVAIQHLSLLDPQIKVSPVMGKTINDADSLAAVLAAQPDIRMALPTIEERGLVIVGNQQMPVMFKGLPDRYQEMAQLDSIMLEGVYATEDVVLPLTQISSGVALKTGARSTHNNFLQLYVPRRLGRINPANPSAAFKGVDMMVSGIFQVGLAEYDTDHIFVPLDQARELLQYTTEATSIDISLTPGADEAKVIARLKKQLGDTYRVETRIEQQQESFRMIEVEKWVTFLMLAFILIIASFNIISTLSLLVIEKRDNMQTLRALGAPKCLIRRIFIIQGWLISIVGGVVGVIMGTLLALGQQHFGWIKLSGDPSQLTVASYPVHVILSDTLIVLGLVIIVGLVTSQVTRIFISKEN